MLVHRFFEIHVCMYVSYNEVIFKRTRHILYPVYSPPLSIAHLNSTFVEQGSLTVKGDSRRFSRAPSTKFSSVAN